LRALATEPVWRAVALAELGLRGAASHAELVAHAADPDADVAGAALVGLALQAPHHPDLGACAERALGIPERGPRAALALGLAGHGERAADAACTMLGSHPQGRAALQVVALCGGERHARKLAESELTDACARALGIAGWVPSVPRLLDELGPATGARRTAIAAALERITGAALHEEAAVDPETLGFALGGGPTADLDDVRDTVRDSAVTVGSPDVVARTSERLADWQAYWQREARAFDPAQRYRNGRVYTPAVLLDELDHGVLGAPERVLLAFELVTRSGLYVPFDPRWFVPAQERALAAWRPAAHVVARGWDAPLRASQVGATG
jgi:hypothetical protein